MIICQDTKKPNREPFEISEEGFKGLQEKYGDRYVSLKRIIVTPDKVTVKPLREIATPAKAN